MDARPVIGVDPGLGGALALYNPDPRHPPIIYDMPVRDGKICGRSLDMFVAALASEAPDDGVAGVIENVSSRPRQAGAFNFGLSTGIIHGVLAANGIAFELVTPTQWKTAMGLKKVEGETYDQNKDRARALAAQLFPQMADQFKRKKDDGRAEALLLAVYYANRRTK